MTRKPPRNFLPAEPAGDTTIDPETGLDENGYDRPSKSQLKREMLALQVMGAALADLPRDALAKMPMPETLSEAIHAVRRITSHEGRRRQMQYVGKVMRTLSDDETAALQRALDVLHGADRAETARLHAIERWRDRLLADDAAFTLFIRSHAVALDEVQHGRTLIRNARREALQNKPPRYFREVFQWVKTCLAQHAQAPGGAAEAAQGPADADDVDTDVDADVDVDVDFDHPRINYDE